MFFMYTVEHAFQVWHYPPTLSLDFVMKPSRNILILYVVHLDGDMHARINFDDLSLVVVSNAPSVL